MLDGINPLGNRRVQCHLHGNSASPSDDEPKLSTSSTSEQVNVSVHPITHNGLFSLRNPFAIAAGLKSLFKDYFVSEEKLLRADPDLASKLRSFIKAERIDPDDFINVLKRTLDLNQDEYFRDKIIKSLVSLEEKDYVLNEFLIPSLEKTEGVDRDYAASILQFIGDVDKTEVLEQFDYSLVKKLKPFAASLILGIDPNFVFNALSDNSLHLLKRELDVEDVISKCEKMQIIQAEILKTLHESNGTIANSELEVLYKNAVNETISGLVSKIINAREEKFAIGVYRDVVFTPSKGFDEEDLNRRKFHAMGHYAALKVPEAVIDFREVIENESNSFLVSGATFYLSQRMDNYGTLALEKSIIDSIESGRKSLSFAAVVLLAMTGKPEHVAVLNRVLSCEYDAGNNIKKAFRSLKDEDLCNVYLSEKNCELFPFVLKKNPRLAAELVISLGFETLSKWISEESDVNLRRNTLDLIDFALSLNHEELNAEILSADLSDHPFSIQLRRMIGASEMGERVDLFFLD